MAAVALGAIDKMETIKAESPAHHVLRTLSPLCHLTHSHVQPERESPQTPEVRKCVHRYSRRAHRTHQAAGHAQRGGRVVQTCECFEILEVVALTSDRPTSSELGLQCPRR